MACKLDAMQSLIFENLKAYLHIGHATYISALKGNNQAAPFCMRPCFSYYGRQQCEQASPAPAMQLQCAKTTVPL